MLVPCREEVRPSVFDRLTNGSEHKADGTRTKMRMDSVPASQVDASSLSYEDSEPAATPSVFVVRLRFTSHQYSFQSCSFADALKQPCHTSDL